MHCAISLILFFAGIAAVFFSLHAEFLGAIQIIVYVGAIAVLILFAIMLTHRVTGSESSPFSVGAIWGWLAALIVFGIQIYSLRESISTSSSPNSANLTVADIGQLFMTRYAIPFEVISLLLTAALVGAVIIAMEEHTEGNR